MRLDDLDSYFQERARRDAFSGVALITQGPTQLFAGAYGYASRSWSVPTTLATRFDIASVTKLFTAVATLQLIERGALTFDTPVVETLGLQGTTIAPAVTVSHLLTHTSGIADDADEESREEYADLWTARPNYAVRHTRDFLPQFAFKPSNFPPGQGCRYCNCGYVLLGLLIERASGLSYRDYVRQQIFAPAGMLHSDFFCMDVAAEEVAEGCDPQYDAQGRLVGWKKNITPILRSARPTGGRTSPPTTWSAFCARCNQASYSPPPPLRRSGRHGCCTMQKPRARCCMATGWSSRWMKASMSSSLRKRA